MSELRELNLKLTRPHPILPKAKLYDVRKVLFLWGYEHAEDGCLELEMSSHEEYLTLKFTGVHDFCVYQDMLSAIAINILDTSEFITTMPAPIRVDGGISFWADEVFLVDRVKSKN